MDWDEYFIRMAMLVAQKSKDPSTKVGVVIAGAENEVVSVGFNGFPRGVREYALADERERCPVHYHLEPDGRCNCSAGPPLDTKRWARPEKYRWIAHAEQNAVFNAARHGIALSGCRLYINLPGGVPFCSACTQAIIQVGIVEAICPAGSYRGAGHGVHYQCGDVEATMLQEAGVRLRQVQLDL